MNFCLVLIAILSHNLVFAMNPSADGSRVCRQYCASDKNPGKCFDKCHGEIKNNEKGSEQRQSGNRKASDHSNGGGRPRRDGNPRR